MQEKIITAAIFKKDKQRLEELKKQHGYASIAVVISKLLAQFGDKIK